jgi:hypothetical protein
VRRGSGARLSELVACVQAGTTQRRSPSNANRSQGSQLAGLIQPQLAAMAPGKTKPPEPEPESYPLPSEAPINTTYDVAVQSCKGDRFPLVRITLPLLTLAHPVRADWGLGRCRYARQSTFIRRTQAKPTPPRGYITRTRAHAMQQGWTSRHTHLVAASLTKTVLCLIPTSSAVSLLHDQAREASTH